MPATGDLAVVVWRSRGGPRSRRLEAVVSERTGLPVAFPLPVLAADPALSSATTATDRADLLSLVEGSDRSRPVVVPLPLARSALGWLSFAGTDETEDGRGR
jgi:hypothetical protein